MPIDREQVNSQTDAAEDDCAGTHAAVAYGCCFCLTGKEWFVAERIHQRLPDVRTLVARREKHMSAGGKKRKVEEIVFPGYVFFAASADTEPRSCFPREGVIRILTTETGVWQLIGEDERFARWLFEYDGLLGFSQAYKEGERIRIVSGPLKDMEGKITRIDKRGHSGQVVLDFNGKSTPVWLGFDLIQIQNETKEE